MVGFTKAGEKLVGSIARRQAITNPENTVYSIKRFMGRRHSEVENEEKRVPYKVTGGAGELVKVEAGGKEYTPPEVSAIDTPVPQESGRRLPWPGSGRKQ